MLGPAAVGSVSVALLAVAIAEALSDTGLAQAVIQGEHSPTKSQPGAVWTMLTARGIPISLLLVALSPLLSSQFHLNGSLVLLQLVASEALKTTLTWATMNHRPPIRPVWTGIVWTGIGQYVGFSRWIWASSVINLLLNKFDKVVVGKLLGPAQLGGYQMSSRLINIYLLVAALGLAAFVEVLRLVAEPLFSLILGAAWLPAVPLFRILVINMASVR
ncbi:MAG: Lipopolysaccharide biosynthesis protein [uncultured Paraburkholderia sp.]|nr:MAG: Lipopolysaccharide biosynthesis protein [uncultured Paraburkholderia sp.]CAH2935010.1 MAG: Lipopolysaccharide biosynthesis protein [uncultured Paraburkholderia sp.]